MRTFSRETFLESKAAWDGGEFGPEWHFYRQLAADRGFLYPPSGTRWDSFEDDQPSQRAMIYRAIDETPGLLADIIRKSHSWHDVIARLTQGRDSMREDADLRERQDRWDRQDEITPPQALQTIAAIVYRIKDSAA